jgi:SAM-dependent methyltransferase
MPIYTHIVASCESDLDKYGDTFQGVGWTKKPEYAALRYRVMLDGLRADWPRPLSLLDFGCGASHLLEYIRAQGLDGITYSGLDLSEKYLELSRRKFPEVEYHQVDLVDPSTSIPEYDFIVLNGLFNYRGEATREAMWDYMRALLRRAWPNARRGMAFNVMSKYVDWEREDLFFLPFDTLAAFVAGEFGRSFVIRHDYGLFEYTVYVYRESLSDLV